VGGLAGKEVGEQIDPTTEDAYWRENYRNRSYVEPNSAYDVYQPAYRYGWEAQSSYSGRNFDEAEPELKKGWNHPGMTWDKAKQAVRDAFDRTGRAISGRK
jgi:hypothetical protein